MRYVVPSQYLRRPARLGLALLACAAGACTAAIGPDQGGDDIVGEDRGGSGGGASEGGSGPAACRDEQPGASTFRRLTSEELARSLEALLGRAIAITWPQDELTGGYASARDNLVLEPHARSLYTDLLPELRKIVATSRTTLSSACATANAACAASLIDGFAGRAWRRPVTQEEKISLLAFYDQANQELGDANEATANLLVAILSSPHFLYRSEIGAGAGAARKLTSREVGTALSFFFLGQPPDAPLLEAIAQDKLQTEAQILAAIERLRASPGHAAWMARFFQQWTHVHDLAKKDHAVDKFPDATAAYKQEAEQAFLRQIVSQVEKPNATFEALVAGTSFVAGPLTAKAYKTGAKPGGLEAIEAEAGRRGLFMTVAFLTQYSKPDRPSSIERAKFFVDSALCLQLPGSRRTRCNASSCPIRRSHLGRTSRRSRVVPPATRATACSIRLDSASTSTGPTANV